MSSASLHYEFCVCLGPQSCLTLCDPMDCSLPGSSIHGIVLGQNTGVGYHFLLQRIFPVHGSNLCLLCLLYCRQILYPLSHQGSPPNFVWWSLYSIPVWVCCCIRLFAVPWTTACQPPLSIEFSRQGYRGRLPFSSPRNLPNSGIIPAAFVSLALAGRFFTTVPPERPRWILHLGQHNSIQLGPR